MSHAINHLYIQLSTLSSNSELRHQDLSSRLAPSEQPHGLDARLQAIEMALQTIHRDIEGKDYQGQIAQLHNTLRDSHSNLAESLPLAMNQSE